MTRLTWPWQGQWRQDGSDPGPWAGVSAADFDQLAAMVRPLRRVLLLMGYSVPLLYAQTQAGPDWAVLDLHSMQSGSADPGEGPPSGLSLPEAPPCSMSLPLTPYRTSSEPDAPAMGIPLPVLTLPSASDPNTSFLSLSAADVTDLHTGADELAAQLREHAVGAVLGEELVPGGGTGLLWLVDPTRWWADLEGARLSPHVREMESVAILARDVILETLGTEGDPLGHFVTEQVTLIATPRPGIQLPPWLGGWRSTPTLKHLLRWIEPGAPKASRRAASFFQNLGSWVEGLALTSVLTKEEIELLADRQWFEVIATLIDRSLLTPPDLHVTGIGADLVIPPPPVEAVRVDSATVELTVLRQVTIRLTVARDAEGNEIVPQGADPSDTGLTRPIREFTWDFLTPRDPNQPPTLVIVASPGVDIGFPRSPEPVGWTDLIIRVPDVSVVPEWGTAVIPTELLTPYAIGPDEGWELVLPGQPPAAPVTQVTPKPDGVTLVYPSFETGAGEQLVAVDITLAGDALLSGNERFGWDVVYYIDDRGSPLPEPTAHIVVWATSGVDVRVVTTALTTLRDYRLDTEVWRVPDSSDIPTLGTPLPFNVAALEHFADWPHGYEPPWTTDDGTMPSRFERDLDAETFQVGVTWWFSMVVDLIVGQIPLVGDVVDIADFFYALGTGKDKWGQPVTRLDLMIMGGCALMPFVSGSLVKGMGNVIEGLPIHEAAQPLRIAAPADASSGLRSGGTVSSAAPTRGIGFDDLIYRANTPEGLALEDAREVAEQANVWNALSAGDRQAVASRLLGFATQFAKSFGEEVAGRFLILDDLLDGSRENFRFWYLRRELENWRQTRMFAWDGTPPPPDLSVDAFVQAPPNNRVRALLQAVLGDDIVGSEVRRARRSPRAAERCPSLARVVFRESPPSRGWLEDYLAGAVPNVPPLADFIEAALEYRRGIWGGPAPIWWDQAYLQVPDVGTWGTAAQYTAWSERLLARGLDTLIGPNKSFHPDELAEILVTAIDIANHELRAAGRSLDDVLPATGAPRIRGLENFVNGLVTVKLPEHAARLELRMATDALVEGPPNNVVRLGARLPGVTDLELREGPDALRYFDDGGSADILQGKSFASLTPLATTRRIAGWFRGGEWRGPEVFRQTVSDLLRMANQPVRCALPALDEGGETVFSGLFEITISRIRFLTTPVENLGSLNFITRRGLDPEEVLRWPAERLINEFEATELCTILDHIKTRFEAPSIDRIDTIAEAVVRGLEDQLNEFLNPVVKAGDPRTSRQILNDTLGIIIPDEIPLEVKVHFR